MPATLPRNGAEGRVSRIREVRASSAPARDHVARSPLEGMLAVVGKGKGGVFGGERATILPHDVGTEGEIVVEPVVANVPARG